MKVIFITGVPCVGKSTIVQSFINTECNFKFKKMRGHLCGKTLFLGVYEQNEVYPGTDKLAMSVQPDVQEWLASKSKTANCVVIEGDRLCNPSMLEFCHANGLKTEVVVIEVSPAELAIRREKRKDKFNPTWLKGRETKVSNFRAKALALGFQLKELTNNSNIEMSNTTNIIRSTITAAQSLGL